MKRFQQPSLYELASKTTTYEEGYQTTTYDYRPDSRPTTTAPNYHTVQQEVIATAGLVYRNNDPVLLDAVTKIKQTLIAWLVYGIIALVIASCFLTRYQDDQHREQFMTWAIKHHPGWNEDTLWEKWRIIKGIPSEDDPD